MRSVSFTIFIGLVILCTGYAQPVLTPRNIALGGGGSTYITDYNANFYNPANLLIKDRKGNVDFGFLITGSYFIPVQSFSNLDNQRKNFEDYLTRYKPGNYTITGLDKAEIIENNYAKDKLTSPHQSRLESTLFGIHWKKDNKAYSLAFRTRTSSSFEVGRNWYTDIPVTIEGTVISNQTLKHRYQTLHEVSFGYAESMSFFNGMSSRIDNFIVGIAPKLVLGGAYQNASWQNVYKQETNSSDIVRSQNFEYSAAGNFSDATSEYLNGVPADQAIRNNINPISNQAFDIYGVGAGLDIGFTYLLTLGSDLSTLQPRIQQTRKSLRIAFSITDIGFVSYKDKGIEYTSEKDTTITNSFPNSANDAFVGAPGQFLQYVDQFGEGNPFQSFTATSNTFSVLLPTAIHGGVMLELNRIKLSGDVSMGLTNNAFNSKKIIASMGAELRVLKFLPLRAGMQLASELPGFISFGTAIETRFWDLSLATQLSTSSLRSNTVFAGVTVAALQFHL